MVSVICQCRNSWMHESPDVSPSPVSTPVEDPCYNYKRDHELSISISLPPFHPLVHEGEKEGIFLHKSRECTRISFLPWFFLIVRTWSIYLNPLPCAILYRSVWERNLPFCFLYKFSNTLFQLFVSLHRISSPSPIRFLLASIPERDRLDDLPSMWKQKKKKYRFVRGNESKRCSPAWKKTWYFRSSFRNSRVHCLRRFTPVQRISFDFRPKWSTFSTPSGIVLRKSKNWNRFGNLLP